MNVSPRASLITLALALVSTPVAAEGGSGEVSLRDSLWTAVDSVAFFEGQELRVAFSDEAFDRDAMRRDGTLNIFDVLRHSGQTLTLGFGGNTPSGCFDFYVRAGDLQSSGSQCDGDLVGAFSGVSNSATRASGAIDWRKGKERIALRWDLPVMTAGTSGAEDAPPGVALPADGGEPGKAVLDHFGALQKGDWKAFKARAHPDRRAKMEESERSGEHLGMFELPRTFAAEDIQVTGGRVDGDRAAVEFTGRMDGQAVRGTADVQKDGSRWYLVGTQYKDG